jgi:hypothetical protein
MKIIHVMAIGLIVNSFAQVAQARFIFEEWQGFSNPDIINSGFSHRIYDLPLEGAAVYNPYLWSGSYWPSKVGGINNRWNDPRFAKTFNYSSPSRDQVSRMSQEQLALLSPTEKYDLLMGNYDYPLKAEVYTHVSAKAEEWEGICHGWAPAAVNHPEPQPAALRNPDGIVIPFGSADIKALVSYYYAFHSQNGTSQVGLRCNFGSWTGGRDACDQDLNAGAYHIIMTNKLGMSHEGFVMDVDRFKEVWNQPVVGYRSKVMSDWMKPQRGASSKAVAEIRIATTTWYTDEDDSSWKPDFGTDNQTFNKKDYVYRVEVDANGYIVGGTWESEERPDFIWNAPKVDSFEGILSGLEYLVNP